MNYTMTSQAGGAITIKDLPLDTGETLVRLNDAMFFPAHTRSIIRERMTGEKLVILGTAMVIVGSGMIPAIVYCPFSIGATTDELGDLRNLMAKGLDSFGDYDLVCDENNLKGALQ